MSITITSDLADEFGRAGQPVEVRAPDGRIIGVFTPVVRPPEPEITEEELQIIEDPHEREVAHGCRSGGETQGVASSLIVRREWFE